MKRRLPRSHAELESRFAEVKQNGIIEGARSTEHRMMEALKARERKLHDEENSVLRDSMRALGEMSIAQAKLGEALAKVIHARLDRHFVE
jgi:hypothetical protein